MEISELKATYTIAQAWSDLALPGRSEKVCSSPFREDVHPSFSVFADGRRWRDFATGETGDVVDFVAKAKSCDSSAALRFIRAQTGCKSLTKTPGTKDWRWPALRRGTSAAVATLAGQRGFSIAALRDAEDREFLHFGKQWGRTFWGVTDSRRTLLELRRIGGEPWPAFGRLPARKAHCFGTGKNWPIGTLESVHFPKVALCEGAPDFLALISIAEAEEKKNLVAPLAMLGGGIGQIASDALPYFRGKHVRIFPHVDRTGLSTLAIWARQIANAGATKVDAFDLGGLVRDDRKRGKDVADLCRIDPECFERYPKFREVLP